MFHDNLRFSDIFDYIASRIHRFMEHEMSDAIKDLIGDYDTFCANLFAHPHMSSMSWEQFWISHLCVRTKTHEDYEHIFEGLLVNSASHVEHQHNKRNIAVVILQKKLVLENNQTISMIELTAPKESVTYETGLEHIGMTVQIDFTTFEEMYRHLLDPGEYANGERFLFFNGRDGSKVKFCQRSLEERTLRSGWQYHDVVEET